MDPRPVFLPDERQVLQWRESPGLILKESNRLSKPAGVFLQPLQAVAFLTLWSILSTLRSSFCCTVGFGLQLPSLRGTFNTHSVMRGLNVRFYNSRGVPRHHATRRDIASHYTCGSNYTVVANPYSRQHNSMGANEAVIANVDVLVAIVYPVMRQDGCAKCDHRVFPNVYSSGVGLVHLGTEGNDASLANLDM